MQPVPGHFEPLDPLGDIREMGQMDSGGLIGTIYQGNSYIVKANIAHYGPEGHYSFCRASNFGGIPVNSH